MKPRVAVTTALLNVVACGAAPHVVRQSAPLVVEATTNPKLDPVALLNDATAAFAGHETNNDWNAASCADVAARFDLVAHHSKSPSRALASFNAGLAWERCGSDAEASARFAQALTLDPGLSQAQTKLALLHYKASGDLDAAIHEIEQAVSGPARDPSAYVALARLEMVRNKPIAGVGCTDDLDCARANFQRALAVDDAYMPALDGLALDYFAQARKRAGTYVKQGHDMRSGGDAKTKHADAQQLELAALICSQGIRKNAGYAPIHNTAGLIANELGQVSAAAHEFGEAASLDAGNFEAHMNVGLINLSFRGWDKAQAALEKAVAIRPRDYEAHLSLALALRGQLTDDNHETLLPAVKKELATAEGIDADRPEAYYNEGILAQELELKWTGKDHLVAELRRAEGLFKTFLGKADGKPQYEGAVKLAKEHLDDIQAVSGTFLTLPL